MSKMQIFNALPAGDLPQRLQAINDYQELTGKLVETAERLESLRMLIDQAGICLSRELAAATARGQSLETALTRSVTTLEGFPEALAGRLAEIEGQVERLAAQMEATSEATGNRVIQQIQDILSIQRNTLTEYGRSLAVTVQEATAAPLSSLTAAAGEARKAQANLQTQADSLSQTMTALDTLPVRTQAQADRLEAQVDRLAAKEIPGFWGLAALMGISGLVGGAIAALALLFLVKTGVISSSPSPPPAQPQAEQPAAPPPADSPTPKSGRRGR